MQMLHKIIDPNFFIFFKPENFFEKIRENFSDNAEDQKSKFKNYSRPAP